MLAFGPGFRSLFDAETCDYSLKTDRWKSRAKPSGPGAGALVVEDFCTLQPDHEL